MCLLLQLAKNIVKINMGNFILLTILGTVIYLLIVYLSDKKIYPCGIRKNLILAKGLLNGKGE